MDRHAGALLRHRDGRLTEYLTEAAVNIIFADGQGGLWVGLDPDGLRRFQGGALATVDELDGQYVKFIHEDRRGVLWFATDGRGLVRLEEGRFTRITTLEGLSSDALASLHEGEDGVLWIGTAGGGLNRLEDGVVTRYSSVHGLHEDSVWSILEDDRQNFWMIGDRGISRVGKEDIRAFDEGRVASLSPVVYGTLDGMRSPEGVGFGEPSGWRTRDGRLWFATMGGLATIDPKRVATADVPPPSVRIEEVAADAASRAAALLAVLGLAFGAYRLRARAVSSVATGSSRRRERLSETATPTTGRCSTPCPPPSRSWTPTARSSGSTTPGGRSGERTRRRPVSRTARAGTTRRSAGG